ncbi:MAG: ABC transporter permease [Anaerolineales bacterium]|jgi:ABC-type multidrug transport system permease subunit
MSAISQSLSRRLRVITAITAKDLLDALKNKTTLGVILPALFILIFYRFIPQISGHDDLTTLYVYDPSGGGAVMLLEDSLDLDVREVASPADVKVSVANGDVPEVGIVLPEDFDPEAGTTLNLNAYTIYWLSEVQRAETVQTVQGEVSFLLDRPVNLIVDGNLVYHEVDSDGLGFLASISIVFVLVMIGISFLPNLMLEEHKEDTMQLLQVSPASPSDIIIAKALTGMFYALIMSAGAWILYWQVFVNPFITAGTFLIGSLLFVLAGLLLGGVVKNRQQLMLIGWVIILPLLLPPFMEIMDDIMPLGLLRVIRFIPSVSLARMLRSSMNIQPDWAFYVGQMVYLLTFVVILFVLNMISIRRRDR